MVDMTIIHFIHVIHRTTTHAASVASADSRGDTVKPQEPRKTQSRKIQRGAVPHSTPANTRQPTGLPGSEFVSQGTGRSGSAAYRGPKMSSTLMPIIPACADWHWCGRADSFGCWIIPACAEQSPCSIARSAGAPRTADQAPVLAASSVLAYSSNPITCWLVGGHEILPGGGHVAARWRPTVLPSGGQQSCPR